MNNNDEVRDVQRVYRLRKETLQERRPTPLHSVLGGAGFRCQRGEPGDRRDPQVPALRVRTQEELQYDGVVDV